MELERFQCALARLYTDASARRELAENPERFAEAFELGSRQVAQLRTALRGGIEEFAQLLLAKKEHEMGRWIPKTRGLLGKRYRTLAREYLGRQEGRASPIENALGFLEWWLGAGAADGGRAARAWARYEARELDLRIRGKRFGAGLFWIPLEHPRKPRRSGGWRLVVWWRSAAWGGRLRRWSMALSLRGMVRLKPCGRISSPAPGS